jgi:predicted ATPase
VKRRQLSEMRDAPSLPRDGSEDSGQATEHYRPTNNLPLALTSLVGREREMAEANRLLGTDRLLTLVGPGGSGKTRLALAAADVARNFGDGVWLVELAPLSDPDLVPQAVASVLGVRETPGTTLVDDLVAHLESRNVLLILDNCEHIIDACASFAAALLRRCPDLRVMVTSREALGIAGETLFAVPTLSLSDPHHLQAAEGLPRYEASRLFVERAMAVRPGFSITGDNAMAIAQIYYRLDGIPLAIELAAAKTRVLSVEQISSRLADSSFRLFKSESRTLDPRQRTLGAAMDWSHDLLDWPERTLFCRLSVFVGGFGLEAAEAVSADRSIQEDDVLDLLSRLVDKSLLLAEEQEDEVRYRMLETVRQYASERLEESGELDVFSRRHAEFYLALAEDTEAALRGPDQIACFRRLEKESDNFRAALSWSLDKDPTEGLAELGLRLTVALWLFWNIQGSTEGHRWIEEALRKTDRKTVARAKALNGGAGCRSGAAITTGPSRSSKEASHCSRSWATRTKPPSRSPTWA